MFRTGQEVYDPKKFFTLTTRTYVEKNCRRKTNSQIVSQTNSIAAHTDAATEVKRYKMQTRENNLALDFSRMYVTKGS